MTTFFYIASLLIGTLLLLSLVRVLKGPTVFDRLTGVGLIGTKTVVLMVLLGVLDERVEMFIDLALTYGLISFIGPLAISKFFEAGGKLEP